MEFLRYFFWGFGLLVSIQGVLGRGCCLCHHVLVVLLSSVGDSVVVFANSHLFPSHIHRFSTFFNFLFIFYSFPLNFVFGFSPFTGFLNGGSSYVCNLFLF